MAIQSTLNYPWLFNPTVKSYLVIFSGLVFTLQKEQKMENIYLAPKEIHAMNILYIYAF